MVVFFFKQKTAYELRISDWSSDVCSSDLTPVMLEMRVRSCHMTGTFVAKDNIRPALTVSDAAAHPVRDLNRIVLPPANFLHEVEKVEQRWPAGIAYVRDKKLNERFGPETGDIGIIVQGGRYNNLNRAKEMHGLADTIASREKNGKG